MLEITRLPGKPAPVARVVLAFTSPEIRCIRRERTGVVEGSNGVITTDKECRSPSCCCIFKRIARGTLRHIRSNGKTIRDHPARHHTHARLDTSSTCFAG